MFISMLFNLSCSLWLYISFNLDIKQIRFGYNHRSYICKFIYRNAKLIGLELEIWNIVKQLWKEFPNHNSSWQSLISFQVSNFISKDSLSTKVIFLTTKHFSFLWWDTTEVCKNNILQNRLPFMCMESFYLILNGFNLSSFISSRGINFQKKIASIE